MAALSAKDRQRMEARAAKLKPKPKLLPSGSWNVQVTINNVRHSVTADTPESAHAQALALKEGLLRKKKDVQKMCLREAIDRYIDGKDAVLSPATIRGYDGIKRNRFQSLMDQNVRSITKEDVQRAVNQESRLVSPKTVYNAYGLVRPVLESCGVDVFGVKLPQQIKKRKKYLQPDDIGTLLDAAKGDKCEIEVLIAVWLGLRRSEIIGLCWDCVDFENSTITVARAYVPNRENKWILKTYPKNEKSQRTIACPGYIMDRLRDIRPDDATGQVFHCHPDTLRKHIHRICERAGITDTTVHGLRHTNAAIMKSLGVDDAHAMARGGWSNEATYKQVYSYVFDQAASTGDEKIDAFFEAKTQMKTHTERIHPLCINAFCGFFAGFKSLLPRQKTLL